MPQRRTEHIAFLEGAKWVIEHLPTDSWPDFEKLATEALAHADKIYPPYDDFPAPSKGNH